MQRNVLIVERSNAVLQLNNTGAENKDYVLEGIFGSIDVMNRNSRIYTEEEYLPQIEALQPKIKARKLLGELDHPKSFETSLNNASHIIEELYYDRSTKNIMGKIRLLNTHAGQQAKALVDAGVPLHISSRAAGSVGEGNKVKIQQLFTYDLVNEPGFENAELKRINESLNITDDNIGIFECKDDFIVPNYLKHTQEQKSYNEDKNMNNISADEFNKFTKHIEEQYKLDSNEIKNLIKNYETLDEKLKSVIGYANYLATQIEEGVNATNEKVDMGIRYSEYIAEKLDNGLEKLDDSINYTEYVAENLNNTIKYTDYVAENLNSSMDYTKYVVENLNNSIDYSKYIAEKLDKSIKYSNYIVENVNGIITEGISVSDEYKDVTEPTIDGEGRIYPDARKAAVSKSARIVDRAKELNAGTPANPITLDPSMDAYIARVKNVLEQLDEADNAKTDDFEQYTKTIQESLNAILNESKEEASKPAFLTFVSKAKQEEFAALDKDKQSLVENAIKQYGGYLSEGQIYAIWNNVLLNSQVDYQKEFLLKAMPDSVKHLWESASPKKQSELIAQSRYQQINTEYQARNFWQTRDWRETSYVNESISINNQTPEQLNEQYSKNVLGYDMSRVREIFKK